MKAKAQTRDSGTSREAERAHSETWLTRRRPFPHCPSRRESTYSRWSSGSNILSHLGRWLRRHLGGVCPGQPRPPRPCFFCLILGLPQQETSSLWMEGFVHISNGFQRLPQTTRSRPNLLRHPGQTWRISLSDLVSCTNLTFWLLLGKEKTAKQHWCWGRGHSGDVWQFLKVTSLPLSSPPSAGEGVHLSTAQGCLPCSAHSSVSSLAASLGGQLASRQSLRLLRSSKATVAHLIHSQKNACYQIQ